METPPRSEPLDEQKIVRFTPVGQPIRSSPSFQLRSPSLNSVRLRRIFDAFDSNGDGQITFDELSHALERLGLPIPLSEIEPTVRSSIKIGSDGIDFEGFAALHRSVGEQLLGYGAATAEGVTKEEQEGELREAFRVFDEDGDGFISAAELKSVLTRLGLADGDDVERMIRSVDQNSDGLVDFAEFKHMMTQAVTL